MVNLFNFESDTVPAILVSLTAKGLDRDGEFLPFRDTTGCAAHVDPDRAIQGALGELVERQCLLRYWMTKSATAEIKALETGIFSRPDVATLVERFQQSGDLTLYDISIPDIAGYAVIVVYGAHDLTRPVQYSSRLCFALSPGKAVEKAVMELWQIFVLLHYSIVSGFDGEMIEDFYHRHFWNMNRRASYTTMIDTQTEGDIALADFLGQPARSRQELLQDVHAITPTVLTYLCREQIGSSDVTMARVFSPDLYLHMNGEAALNHDNAIRRMFPETDPARESSLVLFP